MGILNFEFSYVQPPREERFSAIRTALGKLRERLRVRRLPVGSRYETKRFVFERAVEAVRKELDNGSSS